LSVSAAVGYLYFFNGRLFRACRVQGDRRDR
jgi:hypothetical protein